MTQQAVDTMEAFITGTGRLVQGTPYEKQTTDFATKQPLPENKQKYYVGVAFMKNQDAITKFPILQALMFQAAQQHPNAAQLAAGNWAGYRWKLEDGDDPKHANKPGWPGHYILKFSNGFQPRILDENQCDVSQQPDAVYRGCFVRLVGSVKNNGAQGAQAGNYMNFNTIQRVAHGERIITGPDTAAMLAAAGAAQLPPGASAIPQAPAGGMAMPGAAPQGMPMGGMPGGMPQQPQQQQYAPQGGMPGGMPGAAPQQPQQQYAPQGGMPGGMPGAAPQGQPMGGMPGGMPQGQPQQPMGGMPGGMPQGQPQQQYQQAPQQQYAPQGMPGAAPQGQPQQYQQQPQGAPGGMPMPGGQPQQYAQQGGMPGGMPAGVPGAGHPYAQ